MTVKEVKKRELQSIVRLINEKWDNLPMANKLFFAGLLIGGAIAINLLLGLLLFQVGNQLWIAYAILLGLIIFYVYKKFA